MVCHSASFLPTLGKQQEGVALPRRLERLEKLPACRRAEKIYNWRSQEKWNSSVPGHAICILLKVLMHPGHTCLLSALLVVLHPKGQGGGLHPILCGVGGFHRACCILRSAQSCSELLWELWGSPDWNEWGRPSLMGAREDA